jgi:arylalkylamine N-acetyltransferase
VVNTSPEVEKVLLLCKKELLGFYEGAGFRMVGPSKVGGCKS